MFLSCLYLINVVSELIMMVVEGFVREKTVAGYVSMVLSLSAACQSGNGGND
jgi:hypothetical protein